MTHPRATAIRRRVFVGYGGGFDVYRYDARIPGPRVAVLGGVHGDETEGVLAAARLAASGLTLAAGVVEVVPVCHEAAFDHDRRTSPIDDGNLARVFPGDPAGTATAVLAHHLATEVLGSAEFLIDLHTSGRSYDMPFLVGYHGISPSRDSVAARAALAFGASFVWRHPARSEGRSVSVVEQAIYVEAPGSGRTSQRTVDAYVGGVLRVLQLLGSIAEAPPRSAGRPTLVTGGGDLDRDMIAVAADGILLTEVTVGERVDAGHCVGRVVDRSGQTVETLVSDRSGWVMAITQRSRVHRGDRVIGLAEDDGTERAVPPEVVTM